MTGDRSVRADHPEELLVAYVEGSISEEDRTAAELHLASCPRCKRDVTLAIAGHAALASLPRLEAPGLAPSILQALHEEAAGDLVYEDATGGVGAVDIAAARARRRARFGISRPRVAWGAGLVAAAAAVATFAVLVTSGGTSHPPSASKAAAPEATGASAPAGAVVDRNANYTTASLTALADRLASQIRHGSSFGAASPRAAPAELGASKRLASPQPILTCLRRGGSPDGRAEYLESATFNGAPAYVGAFLVNGSGTSPAHLVVIAVTRNGCQPAFFSTRSL